MQTLIAFLRELGWGVTIGIALLILGAVFFAFTNWGETKKERTKRLSDDAARKKAR